MSRSIYEIKEDLRNIFSIIEEAEGEITDEVGDLLTITKEELDSKVMAYHGTILELDAKNQAIKDEKQRLTRLADQNARLANRLKGKLLDAVNEFGEPGNSGNMKLSLDTLKLWTRASESVEIDDPETFNDPKYCYVTLKLPSDFDKLKEVTTAIMKMYPDDDRQNIKEWNEELVTTVSKSKLSAALKLGRVIKGARLVKNFSVIRK